MDQEIMQIPARATLEASMGPSPSELRAELAQKRLPDLL